MKMTYEQALKDWKYLFEHYCPADDMTGGYVDQDDLDKLLKKPTKSTARKCLVDQIHYWFTAGVEEYGGGFSQEMLEDQKLHEIAERHGAYDWGN